MADYKIVCTDQLPITQPLSHAHIVAVGVDLDNDGYADVKHSKATVIENIRRRRHRYYTVGSFTGKRAYVQVVACHRCSLAIIRTIPDDTRDNNLDHIRRCHWTN